MFTANWTAQPASITFQVKWDGKADIVWNGATGDPVVSSLPDLSTMDGYGTRDGYTFLGWFDKDGTKVTAENLPMTYPAGATVYAAKWARDGYGLFEFVTGGGTPVEDITGESGTTVLNRSMPVTTREGYVFAGWFTALDASGAGVGDAVTQLDATYPAATAPVTYYAAWTAESSTISFVTNGGSDVAAMNGATGDEIASTTMPATARDGYTFEGWYDNAALNGSRVWALPSAFPAGGATYYAKWAADESRIAFVANGGAAVPTMAGKTDQAIADRTMPVPERTGHEFAGWFDNAALTGTAVEQLPAAYPAGGATFYAKWDASEARIVFDYACAEIANVEHVGKYGEPTGIAGLPEVAARCARGLRLRRLVRRRRRQGRKRAQRVPGRGYDLHCKVDEEQHGRRRNRRA